MEASNVIEFPRQIFKVTVRESTYSTLCFPSTDKVNAKRFAEQLMMATSDEGMAMCDDFLSEVRNTKPVAVSIDIVDGSTQ